MAEPEAPSAGSTSWSKALAGQRFVHRSFTMQALSFRFAIRCTSSAVGRHLEALLLPLRSPVPAAHWYSVVEGANGQVDVFRDDLLVARVVGASSVAAWISWDLNRAVVGASDEYLLFHAGGVEAPPGGVLLPATSGSGKSTLVTGLVRSGFRYLSDEVMALDLARWRLVPYPRSIVIEQGTYDLLHDTRPQPRPLRFGTEIGVGDGRQWYLRPGELRPDAVGRECDLGTVVVPRYDAAGPTSLVPLEPSEALLSLASNCLNLDSHPEDGLAALAELAAGRRCYELVVSDLWAACKLLLALFR